MPVTKSERAPMNPPKRGAGAGHTQGPRLWSLLSAPWSIDDHAASAGPLASEIATSRPHGETRSLRSHFEWYRPVIGMIRWPART